MTQRSAVTTFTWIPQNHEIIKQRYGWPPFMWKLVSGPEQAVETYYDSDKNFLSHCGLLVRTRPSKSTGKMQREALETIASSGQMFLTTEINAVHELIGRHIPGSTGPVNVFDLETLCAMLTTRTVFEAVENIQGRELDFRIVLDVTNWGHRVGRVEFAADFEGDDIDPHAQIDAFMERYPTFFERRNVKSTLASWRERMGIEGP